jgi:hypothetical protein
MAMKPSREVAPVTPAGLRSFFQRLVLPAFGTLGLSDSQICGYVVDLLARFARTDQLYRIRDAQGRRLETIAEMLLELGRQWEPEGRYSFDRDLEIRRHCGDYALFMSGLFRAYVERQGLMDYYLDQGQRAYRAVSELGQLSFAAETRLFRALSGHFERLSGALDFVRKVHLRPELHSGPYKQVLRQMDLF